MTGTLGKEISTARQRLAEMAGLSARVKETDRRVLEAATERLEVVNAELAKARPRAMTDSAVAESYQKLIEERGMLQQVIAKAGWH